MKDFSPAPEVPSKEDPEATTEAKDKCLRALMSDKLLAMQNDGLLWLKRRGIMPETAQKYGLGFYPDLDPKKDYDRRVSVAKRIMGNQISTKGVSTFATDKRGKRYLCQKSRGLVIPIKDINNKIVSLRHRPVPKDGGKVKGGKETPFSTAGKPGGCTSHSPAGFYCNWENNRPVDDSDGVYKFGGNTYPRRHAFCITEGPIKAMVMRQEWEGVGPVIAISGVSTVKSLWDTLKTMKELGFKSCENFLDMDEFIPFVDDKGVKHTGNEGVISASKELKRMCKKLGLSYFRRKWDMDIEVNGRVFKNCLKGIDDMLVWKNKKLIPHTLTDKGLV